MSPLLAIVVFLVTLAAAMAVLSAWCRHRRASSETARKALHVTMGLAAAGAPWVFPDPRPIIVLGVLALAWLWTVKRCRLLRRIFGGALHGVRSASGGEFYFVGGVLLAYLLCAGELAYYCTAIVVMSLADTAAALVGRTWGRHRYRDGKTRKSLEGTAAFFAVAFASAAAVLAALSSQPSSMILEAALAVALVATLLEAGGSAGADNLLVPVGVVAALRLLLDPAAFLYATPLLVCVAVIAVAGSLRPRPRGAHV